MLGSRFLLALSLSSTILFAQERHPIHLSRGGVFLGSFPEVSSRHSSPDTIKLLALRVEFQPDTDTLTSGNGTFQLTPAVGRMIDPPPHDASYFAYKLVFLENYFRKVSRGQVIVKGVLHPMTVRLSQKMSAYSPPKDGSHDIRLANLVIDSWRAADSLDSSVPFSSYNAFLIFHAGVGRDVDLVSFLGYDPTPNDIPSLTFTLQGFREYLKEPSFDGIPVSGGKFKITSTMVLPETETRVFVSGTRTDTLHLSVNGLLASSFGTYLGLPDLFDTKTGRSGIGRFGLMDGASIFAYSGLFPPEPSAWEKVFLGWSTPMTITSGSQNFSFTALGFDSIGRDTIYKVPISDKEYFLIENRSRDPQGDGQRLTIWENGQLSTRTFMQDTVGFRFDDARTLSGSVVDVEDFDWALPGLSGFDNAVVGGGVLIWHIDENIIRREFATNTINADPARRGVDLEEADGSQDIGQIYDLLEAGFGSESGTPLDFWFDGNNAPAYKNAFDDNSFPNSKSNSGARSLVSVRDFSTRSSRMTVTIQVGTDKVKRLLQFDRIFATSAQGVRFPSWSNSAIFVAVNNSVYVFGRDGTSKTKDPSGLLSVKGGQFELAVTEFDPNTITLVGAQDSSLYMWNLVATTNAGIFDSVRTVILPLGQRVTTPAAFADLSIMRHIIVGGEKGTVWSVPLHNFSPTKLSVSPNPVVSITQLPTPVLARPNEFFFTSGGRLYSEFSSVSLGDSSLPWVLTATTSDYGNLVVAAQRGGARAVAFNSSLTSPGFEYTIPRGTILSVSGADLDQDGSKEILILSDERIYILNRSGRDLAGFPVSLSRGLTFTGTPLVGDIDGDGQPDVVAWTTSGQVMAYDSRGNLLNGFPIQAASSGEVYPALFPTSSNNVGLLSLSSSGSMQAIELGVPYNDALMHWPQYLHDAQHLNQENSYTPNPLPRSSEFLPASRVYNWPNPVYGRTTQIRYYVPEDAHINVMIFDLAGAKVAELTDRAAGGIDNEMTWDVSNIQSGVYLARIEAKGNSGSSVAVIKIAVVK